MYTNEISVALLQGASSHAQEPCHHGSDVGLTHVYSGLPHERGGPHGASESCSGPPTVCVRRGNRTQGRQEQMFRIDWWLRSNSASSSKLRITRSPRVVGPGGRHRRPRLPAARRGGPDNPAARLKACTCVTVGVRGAAAPVRRQKLMTSLRCTL